MSSCESRRWKQEEEAAAAAALEGGEQGASGDPHVPLCGRAGECVSQ